MSDDSQWRRVIGIFDLQFFVQKMELKESLQLPTINIEWYGLMIQ